MLLLLLLEEKLLLLLKLHLLLHVVQLLLPVNQLLLPVINHLLLVQILPLCQQLGLLEGLVEEVHTPHLVTWLEVLVDFPHGTGHPASPSSPVIGLILYGCQESLQPVRDLGTVVTLFTHLVQELRLSTGAYPCDPPGCCSREPDTWGVLQTLGSTRDPNSTGSSAGSKSVEKCEGMLADTEEADAEEV